MKKPHLITITFQTSVMVEEDYETNDVTYNAMLKEVGIKIFNKIMNGELKENIESIKIDK